MIDLDNLNVWYNRQLVGYLWRDETARIGFRYDEQWHAANGFPISQTLPLTDKSYTPEQGLAHRFFANLLPEGGVRDNIVRDLKIPNNDFDLLRAIGGECAGALVILPVEQVPSDQDSYYHLDDKAFARLINGRGRVSRWHETARPRLSLAGAQDKCPILFRDDGFFLPEGQSPSSHILKFELPDYRNLPAYETFTTLLARAVALPAVDIQLKKFVATYYTLIRRYDRIPEQNGSIRRLHQEDFCQALGYGHDRKYQEFGGPNFADCYNLVRKVSSEPAIDLQHLLRWQIFNVLAGNSDGHAKNLSLLYSPSGEIRLAPFYDLVCTRAIERIDFHLAFSIGGERNPAIIEKRHWEALAKACDIQPRFVVKQAAEIAGQLISVLENTITDFEARYGEYPALQRIEQVVRKQCGRELN